MSGRVVVVNSITSQSYQARIYVQIRPVAIALAGRPLHGFAAFIHHTTQALMASTIHLKGVLHTMTSHSWTLWIPSYCQISPAIPRAIHERTYGRVFEHIV